MNTFDKIDLLLHEKKKKQIDLTNYLGIPKANYTDWKTGRTKSYTKYLSQIAEYFDVSVDFLIGKTEQKERLTTQGSEQIEDNVVVFHRDGKTVTKKFTPAQMELIAKLLEEIPEDKQ